MNLSELRNLDINDIGSWPAAVKSVVLVCLCIIVAGAWYWLLTRDQLDQLHKAQLQEPVLFQTLELRQQRAANLGPLKAQLAQMKHSFGTMLQLLPNKSEMEGLLVDISQAGLAAGLEFQLFKPLREKPADFYAIQPIQIRVHGTYHQLAEFVSSVAALPRIVTVHNIAIAPAGKSQAAAAQAGGRPVELLMSVTAQTYRYLSEDAGAGAKGNGTKSQ